MSSTLYWRPPDPQGSVLETKDDSFKLILRNEFGTGERICLHKGSIDWLRGMTSAGVDGPAEVIRLIRRYGSVVLWEGTS